MRRCGHTLCFTCAAGFPGGTCPVPGCGKYSQRKELVADRSTVVRWDAAQRLKRLLARDYSAEKENRVTNGKGARDVGYLSPSKEVPAPPKEVGGADKAAAASRPPSQKEDLFQDTDEELYAVAEESVKILEESRKETSMVLQELVDWVSQNTEEEADTVTVSVHKGKQKGGGRKKNNKFLKSKEKASPAPGQQQSGDLCKKPKKALKFASKRASNSNPTASTIEPVTDALQGPKNSRGNGETTRKKSAAPTSNSIAALNKRNMKGETLLHRECIKGNVCKVRAKLQ